jgi:cyanophycinase-like exopeptidase
MISIGLSVLPNVIIDTHFKERAREERLGSAVRSNGKIGWGISEDSAIVIKNGNMKTFGDVEIIS